MRDGAASAAEDGGNDKKKREKKGFKVDRYENYQRKRLNKITGKDARKDNSSGSNNGGKRVRAITFDEAARRDYLLTMHKRKNERRVKAFVDAKHKLRRDNAKTRRAQREEARQAYNRFAAVPILPNFTYQLPRDDGEEEEEEEEGEVEDQAERGEGEMMPDSADKRKRRLPAAEKTVHVMPSAMRGESDATPVPQSSGRLDDDYVTVEVKPLFGKPAVADASAAAPLLPANDFSDLPAVVEQELRRLKKETKGPTRTKPRIQMLKELEKIRKIKKHSRKGHGKKTAKGKKRHR
ncbi:hypothetical protein DQ04_04701050 [Trypanosoma grayi]|uniref:hypothetical protein n=1 Tax=Trypanosoma grayi TaxID=71804 RepID=UPI0004F3FAB3|nr:hypothetical protein DQ04_04701050 [Trypanosoma grayi]KEG09760.1 hypothetical protein DQ04_04701050 [Trypanosoma grayi]